jgi:RNA polymerase sigma factor (sigma-70 family)
MPVLSHNDNLWNRFRNGDEQALFVIYKTYYNYLYKCGLKLSGDATLTADLINQVFLGIWERKGGVGEVEHIKAYLVTALKRMIYKEWEARDKHRTMLQSPDFVVEEFQQSIEEHLVQLQLKEDNRLRLLAAIKKLSPRQQELISMRFYQELSYEEMADKTGLSSRTIYNAVYEALKKLKTGLLQKVMLLFFILSVYCYISMIM